MKNSRRNQLSTRNVKSLKSQCVPVNEPFAERLSALTLLFPAINERRLKTRDGEVNHVLDPSNNSLRTRTWKMLCLGRNERIIRHIIADCYAKKVFSPSRQSVCWHVRRLGVWDWLIYSPSRWLCQRYWCGFWVPWAADSEGRRHSRTRQNIA